MSSENGKEFYKKDNPSEKIIVGPTESMSKSKKNTIDPENIIKNYGADSVRLFILSDSPPEKDVQWWNGATAVADHLGPSCLSEFQHQFQVAQTQTIP